MSVEVELQSELREAQEQSSVTPLDIASTTKTYADESAETVTRSYTYEHTNKNGKKVTKKVVRKYTNKKDTTNTLQNKTNKDIVEKNINDNYDKIMELPERKRMKYIRDYCIPNDISASYNTIKAIWSKIITSHTVDTEKTE